ncbi:MAG: hypothetical protein LLF96_11700 [Eubacteriales bacterium]|nr:hypothetical protein [Eubacteriales bacterium]
MSVIWGLLYKDGRPITDELAVMYSGIHAFPHEKHSIIVQGNCGFGHMLTYNTPEAVNESMPKWLETARLMFVAEGRIDNREELFQALSVPAQEQAGMPGGDLMLMAYLRWGENCVDRLMGKWSLAAFHTDQQKLFIARDKWDYTDITYYADDHVFAFATSEKGLLPLPFVPKEIDELKVAQLLIAWPGDYTKSFIKGLIHLQPAHTLQVTREKVVLHRYWNYADIHVRKGLKLEDYVEDLFNNLNKAVTARLRSYTPIAATLSGGLDSSTVCVLAAEQLAKQGKRLKTYSHVPQFEPSATLPQPKVFGNEKPYIEAIVETAGNIDPTFLNSAELSPLAGIKEALRMCGQPFHGACNAYWVADIYNSAAKDHYGTMLMGEFGNATTSWNGLDTALPAASLLKRYGMKGMIVRKVFMPVLFGNTPFAHIYKRVVCGDRPWGDISYCARTFEDSLQIAEQIKKSGFDMSRKLYFKNPKSHAMRILDLNVARLAMGANIGCETGLELRDPTGDPRVIESALAIPNEMYFGDMNRWVLRTMMKGRLPDMVRLNAKKGKQSADIVARLYAHRDEMERVLADMESFGFGRVLDLPRIRTEWEKLKADQTNYPMDTAAHILRSIMVFELYRMLPEFCQGSV